MSKRPYKRRPADEPLPDVSVNLKHYRQLAGMTAAELAEEAGVSTIAMIETGRRPNAWQKTLDDLAAALSRRLGYTITASHLRAPPRRDAEAIEASLQKFLSTPAGEDGRVPSRLAALRSVDWGGKLPSEKSWYLVLRAIIEAEDGPS